MNEIYEVNKRHSPEQRGKKGQKEQ